MNNLSMYLGEYRRLAVSLSSKDRSEFVVHKATYTLTFGHEIVSSGDCAIDGKTLLLHLDPKSAGFHVLEFTIYIADEIIIKRVNIQVLESMGGQNGN